MHCIKKALLTAMLQNSSRVSLYEEKGNVHKILPEAQSLIFTDVDT